MGGGFGDGDVGAGSAGGGDGGLCGGGGGTGHGHRLIALDELIARDELTKLSFLNSYGYIRDTDLMNVKGFPT